jgi:4-hydroxy-tetrahydrodipicolinate reductase
MRSAKGYNSSVMVTPLKIAVCGAAGRTGSRAAALASADPRFHLVARVDRSRAAEFEEEAGSVQVAVDFSSPDSCVRFAAACAAAKTAFVTGTTGLSVVQRAQLAAAAKKIPVFAAPNFSRGVVLMTFLAAEAAKRLPDYDAAIVETHHKGKKDAPSGTALRLEQAVREARGSDAPVPTFSLRLGDVAGDHELSFAGPFELLKLSHRAQSRDAFALGALEAALWTAKKKPGLYDMNDLLRLR